RRLGWCGGPCRAQARRRARQRRGRGGPRRRRLEVSLRRLLGCRRRRTLDGAHRLVVIPADVRAALVAHSEREAPNEACGLVLLCDGTADRYEPGRNAAASPYRFELEFDDPEIWYAEDDGYELAVFHTHVAAPAR